jgi:hypothetical protein
MSFVVSANYRNRGSEYRWLVRGSDEPIDKAIACKRVEMQDVKFQKSSEEEVGFGCNIVAVCDTVEVFEKEEPKPEPTPVRLLFGWNTFFNPENRAVTRAKSVTLGDDGSVMAILT